MATYLYVLAVGPIQDFIAAARRTRDLWFGSHLLSEISKAAAKQIAGSGGKLIFPARKKESPDLEPSDEPDAFNVANIILAEVDTDNITGIDKKAKTAAQVRWETYAREACKIIDKAAKGAVQKTIWQEQIKDVIECYSAWVPLKRKEDYKNARKRLMYLLAGRKSIRNFSQPSPFPKTPKCSLCGARESVFIRGSLMKRDVALRLRLKGSEELCAVGLTKRLGGGKLPFPSVVRVACNPWICGVRKDTRIIGGKKAADILDEIAKLCAGDTTFASGTGRRKRDGKYEKMYPKFPFDGQILYPERLKGLTDDLHKFIGSDAEIPDDEKIKIKSHVQELLAKNIDEISSLSSNLYEDLVRLEEIKERVRILQKEINGMGFGFGSPDPYLAILSADGDGMGAVISSRETADEHRSFSSTLSGFAGDARKIVEQRFSGCMVYSGGDDVFAFLPVDQCIGAARALHDKFGETMKQIADGNKTGHSPTLSVGIAIGHSLDPLEDLLSYAREAERAAKDPNRNGLALHLHVRGGGEPIKIREQWKDVSDPKGIDKQMERWVEMHVQELLPDRAAYDLLELAGDYKGWKGAPSDLIKSDIKRLLHRKRAGQGSRKITEDDITFLTERIASYGDIVTRADELIIARRIAHIRKMAEGASTGGVAP